MDVSGARSLRFDLPALLSIAVLVPLIAALLVCAYLVHSRVEAVRDALGVVAERSVRAQAGPDLSAHAARVALQLDGYLIARIGQVLAWVSSPVVVEAARGAHAKHEDAGFGDLSRDALEARFVIAKSLGAYPQADLYLGGQLAASPDFAEVFFTDRRGYNVAMTSPTSDFIQSDEEWWQRAWRHQIAVGAVEYDNSAGVWSVDISVRIDDPQASGAPLGVLKSVLSIAPVQLIADRSIHGIAAARTLLTTGTGDVIAETASGHARERVMSESANVRAHGTPAQRLAYGSDRIGFNAEDPVYLTAHARTGGPSVYGRLVPRFEGFGWLVIVQRPVESVLAPLGPLNTVMASLQNSVVVLSSVYAAGLVLACALTILVGVVLARRVSGDAEAIAGFAVAVTDGEPVGRPTSLRSKELVDLEAAVYRIYRHLVEVWRRQRTGA